MAAYYYYCPACMKSHEEGLTNCEPAAEMIQILRELSEKLSEWYADCDCDSVREIKAYEIKIDDFLKPRGLWP